MPVCAFIPEHGVVMWAEPQGVFLYKHDPSAEYPVASASPPPTGDQKKVETEDKNVQVEEKD
jgi:hypothetical protein